MEKASDAGTGIIVQNRESLLLTQNDILVQGRKKVIDLIESAINASRPDKSIVRLLNYDKENEILIVHNNTKYNLKNRTITVIGAGKASGLMATAIESIFGDKINCGIVSVPEKVSNSLKTKRIKLVPADHPLPSERNIENTKRIIDLIKDNKDSLVIFLVSGGGSAMFSLPVPPISPKDLIILNNLLIKSGMNINEINTVRKHVSQIKGGKLLNYLQSDMITLILSDVVGDDLSTIASGPSVPDPTTFNDAIQLIQNYNLLTKIPQNVMTVLNKGINGLIPETIKPQDQQQLSKVYNLIIGSNEMACQEIIRKANQFGYSCIFLTSQLEGDTRFIGRLLGKILLTQANYCTTPTVILCGGETTIHVEGKGTGGRNQELAVEVMKVISKSPKNIVFCSAGTDGIDGNSKYAGAIIDNYTLSNLSIDGFNSIKDLIFKFQQNNDVTNLLKKVKNALIVTGPTGTNVSDIQIGLVFPILNGSNS